MKVQPYVFFDGKCEEALEFYKRSVGAKVNAMMRFGEAPDQSQIKPESKNKVMHSAFQIGETEILASDGYCLGAPAFQGFALTIHAANNARSQARLHRHRGGRQDPDAAGEDVLCRQFRHRCGQVRRQLDGDLREGVI